MTRGEIIRYRAQDREQERQGLDKRAHQSLTFVLTEFSSYLLDIVILTPVEET